MKHIYNNYKLKTNYNKQKKKNLIVGVLKDNTVY